MPRGWNFNQCLLVLSPLQIRFNPELGMLAKCDPELTRGSSAELWQVGAASMQRQQRRNGKHSGVRHSVEEVAFKWSASRHGILYLTLQCAPKRFASLVLKWMKRGSLAKFLVKCQIMWFTTLYLITLQRVDPACLFHAVILVILQ